MDIKNFDDLPMRAKQDAVRGLSDPDMRVEFLDMLSADIEAFKKWNAADEKKAADATKVEAGKKSLLKKIFGL
jgi:hypothetical protein